MQLWYDRDFTFIPVSSQEERLWLHLSGLLWVSQVVLSQPCEKAPRMNFTRPAFRYADFLKYLLLSPLATCCPTRATYAKRGPARITYGTGFKSRLSGGKSEIEVTPHPDQVAKGGLKSIRSTVVLVLSLAVDFIIGDLQFAVMVIPQKMKCRYIKPGVLKPIFDCHYTDFWTNPI